MNLPNGKSTSTDFRLFPEAPFKERVLKIPHLRELGIFIVFAPLKYCPVKDVFDFCKSSGGPEKVTSPPYFPALGPISTTQSADSIVS